MGRYTETSDYLVALRRMVRAAGRRVGHADPEDLAVLADIAATLDEAMVAAVAGLRAGGFTWESIGQALGVTRQAALMRFGPRVSQLTAR